MAMDCEICTIPFDENARKPLVGSCGHSLCSACVSLSSTHCPFCKQNFAFINKTVNFQVINHIRESEAAKEELNTMAIKEQRQCQNRSKCTECGSLVDKDQLRLCTGCSETQGIVSLDGDSVKILHASQADRVVICSHCSLEGVHQGHATVLYCKLKFKQEAEKILAEALKTSGCERRFWNLKTARGNLISALRVAISVERNTSGAELEQVLQCCKEVKEDYEAAMRTLEGQIDATVETIESLMSSLKEEAPNHRGTAHGTTPGARRPLLSRQRRQRVRRHEPENIVDSPESDPRELTIESSPEPRQRRQRSFESSPEPVPIFTSTPKRRRQ